MLELLLGLGLDARDLLRRERTRPRRRSAYPRADASTSTSGRTDGRGDGWWGPGSTSAARAIGRWEAASWGRSAWILPGCFGPSPAGVGGDASTSTSGRTDGRGDGWGGSTPAAGAIGRWEAASWGRSAWILPGCFGPSPAGAAAKIWLAAPTAPGPPTLPESRPAVLWTGAGASARREAASWDRSAWILPGCFGPSPAGVGGDGAIRLATPMAPGSPTLPESRPAVLWTGAGASARRSRAAHAMAPTTTRAATPPRASLPPLAWPHRTLSPRDRLASAVSRPVDSPRLDRARSRRDCHRSRNACERSRDPVCRLSRYD